jgi:hypothetical protein
MTRPPVQTLFFLLALMGLSGPAAAQTLSLEECRISAGAGHPGIKARCGTMLRPENPADPESAGIEVRVAVVAALNLTPETDPIVPIAGGRAPLKRCDVIATSCLSTNAGRASLHAWIA